MSCPSLTDFYRQEKPHIQKAYTLIDLQGNIDRQYEVVISHDIEPRRPKYADLYPKNHEENVERLRNAGLPYPRSVPVCTNCRGKSHAFDRGQELMFVTELGHISKKCPEERPNMENEPGNFVNCVNCNARGHRARDCPEPRRGPRKPMTCNNCG